MSYAPMHASRRSVDIPVDRLARWAGRIVAKAALMTALIALLTTVLANTSPV